MLVITADDYGYWPSYNEGILEAVEMGGLDSVSAMVEREHCDPAPARDGGGDRAPHRVRGSLGPAQRRSGAHGAAGAARALRRPVRPLALLSERAQALPRATGAGHSGPADRETDRGSRPLGQPGSPAVASRAEHRYARPADRPHGEQGPRRAAGGAQPAGGSHR